MNPYTLELLKWRLCRQHWKAEEARAWGTVVYVPFDEKEIVWRLGLA